ncbi:alpha beta hydrolase fold protein [Colletotrichum higginsianum]|nr:alpha beta hydrolase fold protein [Colletotrichum higginsianum]
MDNTSRERIWDDPHEWAPENEADWRGDAPAWTVKDFFGVLKDQFITLSFIPTSPLSVMDIYAIQHPNPEGLIARLQETFRSHGWPELESFCKHDCLEAVEAIVKQHDSAV